MRRKRHRVSFSRTIVHSFETGTATIASTANALPGVVAILYPWISQGANHHYHNPRPESFEPARHAGGASKKWH
jgi:hypothetical protein